MRFWYDTEFIDDGKTIDLISIGIVAEDGREFYAVSTEFDAVRASGWVQANVLAKLPPRPDPVWMARDRIRRGVLALLAGDESAELWAYYGAYDHVVLAQLWGPMIDLPCGVPMFTHELMQLWEQAGCPAKPEQTSEHDALADALWSRALWLACQPVTS